MKIPSKSILFLVIICVFLGCSSSLKVTSDYDKQTDFKQFKTFSLNKVNDAQKQSISQLNQDRIYNAVRTELLNKGLTESSSPDLIVHIATILKDKQSVSSNTNVYGY